MQHKLALNDKNQFQPYFLLWFSSLGMPLLRDKKRTIAWNITGEFSDSYRWDYGWKDLEDPMLPRILSWYGRKWDTSFVFKLRTDCTRWAMTKSTFIWVVINHHAMERFLIWWKSLRRDFPFGKKWPTSVLIHDPFERPDEWIFLWGNAAGATMDR